MEAMLKKLEYPLQRKLTEREKEKIKKLNEAGGLAVNAPRNGRPLGLDDTNIAIKDDARLAAEPVQIALDRAGKKIMDGEKEALVPWNLQDIGGMSSAAAPLSWEEYEMRYRNMDKTLQAKVGDMAIQQLQSQFSAMDGMEEYRTIRTFSWDSGDGSGPTTVMLIGVTELSERSRQLASRAVYEANPSALVVQLCRERVGRHLVMPTEHLRAAAHYARSYAATNPHKLNAALYHIDVVNGDFEALKLWMSDLSYSAAVDEFAQMPSTGDGPPKMLCLGDVKKSKLEALRKQYGNHTLDEVPTQSARSKQLVRGMMSMARMGHKVVLGVINSDLLPSATTWLERAGARLVAVADTSDIETGRESLAADVQLGLEAKPMAKPTPPSAVDQALGFGKSQLGAFLNEEAMESLQKRKRRLLKVTRIRDLVKHCEAPKVWKVAELLGDGIPPGPARPGGGDKQPKGLRFEFERLEIPDHYLRDAGMEAYAPRLWMTLNKQNQACETRDLPELEWWANGGTDVEPVSEMEDGVDEEMWEEVFPATSQEPWR